ncbi:MAG: HAMP domain-containing protein [Bacteroidales bacterium]|jgi:signal transduction histidine kinase|nr:HAMP domain-containing protein [Bacteroidales bacterium]
MKTNLRDRFVLFLSLTGIIIIAVTGLLTYRIARESVTDRTFAQLKTIRNARKFQLEQYFRDRSAEVLQLGRSQELNNVFSELNNKSGQLHDGDSIGISSPGSYVFSTVFDRPGHHELILVSDKSNGFIISRDSHKQTAAIYFSQKQNAGFLQAAESSIREKDIIITDYDTASGLPLIHVFAPLQLDSNISGAVGISISADALNSILLEQNDQNGLGYSGEVYVIGNDYLMRSQSRFQEQSVMKTLVKTSPTADVYTSNEGQMLSNDYRGIPVLSSYSRLQIPGLDWAILAEIDKREALLPLENLRNTLLVVSVAIVFVLVFVSFWLSNFFTKPILRLRNAVSEIGNGRLGIQVEHQSSDEIGELADAFNEMSQKLSDQHNEILAREKQLEEERKQRIESFIEGQEKERQRLSRELHDGIGQIFVAARFQLESMGQYENIQNLAPYVASQKLVNQGITELRKISKGLAPSELSEFGLSSALRSLCTQMEESSGIRIQQIIADVDLKLSELDATHLYRILQEALTNAAKHSNASEIIVEFVFENNVISMRIQDNGCGFGPEEPMRGKGLANIRERAALLGAELHINSQQNCGTRIELIYQV